MRKFLLLSALLFIVGIALSAPTVDTTGVDLTDGIEFTMAVTPTIPLIAESESIELDLFTPLVEIDDPSIPIDEIGTLLQCDMNHIVSINDEDLGGNELACIFDNFKPIESGVLDMIDDDGYIEYNIFEHEDGIRTLVGWYQDGYGVQSGFSMIFTDKNQFN